MKRMIENRSNKTVVHLHLSTQHTWPQLSVCLSCVLSASPVAAQLAPVRFKRARESSLHIFSVYKLKGENIVPSSLAMLKFLLIFFI
jgi:hypothetical protein